MLYFSLLLIFAPSPTVFPLFVKLVHFPMGGVNQFGLFYATTGPIPAHLGANRLVNNTPKMSWIWAQS